MQDLQKETDSSQLSLSLILPLIVPQATFWITWELVKNSNIMLICVSLNFHTKRLISSIFDNIPFLLSSFLAELNLSTVNGGSKRSLNLSNCGFLNLSTRSTKGWKKIYVIDKACLIFQEFFYFLKFSFTHPLMSMHKIKWLLRVRDLIQLLLFYDEMNLKSKVES